MIFFLLFIGFVIGWFLGMSIIPWILSIVWFLGCIWFVSELIQVQRDIVQIKKDIRELIDILAK